MDLEPVEQRILGSLLEKQVTVPASYPLTLTSLRTACNQTSSRDPVMELDERTVEQTARALKDQGLLRIVWSDTGRRTLKYHQTLSRPSSWPTTSVRSSPSCSCADRRRPGSCAPAPNGCTPSPTASTSRPAGPDGRPRPAVGAAARAATRPAGPPLGAPAGPGRDGRHGPGAGGRPGGAHRRLAPGARRPGAVDVRRRGGELRGELSDELDGLPFERWLLDRVAVEARDLPIIDAGCGPGHVTAYLTAAGADARGLDLTPEMVDEARQRHPDVRYEVGDLRQLIRPVAATGWGAVLGWYSLIHLAASELPAAVAALARPLAPGGLLVLGMHAGDDVRRVTSWFDVEVPALDFVLHDPASVVAAVEAAGLTDVEWYLRGPHAWRDETTQRLYVVARRV